MNENTELTDVNELNDDSYRTQARDELLCNRTSTTIGFLDQYGYIVDYDDKEPTTLGEGTLHTAIAIVAIATGNYKQDSWEQINANNKILVLLNTLLRNSWGNRGNEGYEHPIRHPGVFEYSATGQQLRASPLTKDSFGAIVAAAYYAYTCPNSNSEIRMLARELISKWAEYLTSRNSQWRTHYNYIPFEFDFETINGMKYYKNIYSKNKDGTLTRVMYKGPEAFRLMPHEIFAFKNVANHMNIPTGDWVIWLHGISSDLKEAMRTFGAYYVSEAAAKGLEYIFGKLNFEVPYSVQLGPDNWRLGKVEGVFKTTIDSGSLAIIFKNEVRKLIQEIVKNDDYGSDQAAGLLQTALNKISVYFSELIPKESWISILTVGLQRVIPWFDSFNWIEVLTFVGTQVLLRAAGPDVISYTFWSFATECETRPEMKDVLKVSTQEFFKYLDGHGNPNGLWAWLAEDSIQVSRQLKIFEENLQRRWWKFAYGSKKYEEWLVEPDHEDGGKKEAPRLDYLIMDGLSEKGPPVGVSIIPNDWEEMFKNTLQSLADKYINDVIKEPFNKLGIYQRRVSNGAQEAIIESWYNTLQYGITKLKKIGSDWKVIERTVRDLAEDVVAHMFLKSNGQWVEEYWKRASENYYKGVWNINNSLISREITHLDNTTSWEIWRNERDTQLKYYKAVWSEEKKRIYTTYIGGDNELTEYIRNQGNIRSYKAVWSHFSAEAKHMISREIVDMDGVMSVENWEQFDYKYKKQIYSDSSGRRKLRWEYTETFDGEVISKVIKENGERGRTIFDKFGNPTFSEGKIAPKVWPDWWPPKPSKPWKSIKM